MLDSTATAAHSRSGLAPIAGLALLTMLVATIDAQAQTAPPPWSRTETRADCTDYEPLRQPLYGDTHAHTTLSFDAVTGGVITGQREAYDFAQGAPIGLPPYDPNNVPLRSAQLRRPLDFTLLSDHAEMFGEVRICLDPGLPGYNDPICQDYRAGIPQPEPGLGTFGLFVAPYIGLFTTERHAFCGPPPWTHCLNEASVVWQDIQDAAEEKYDRSDACTFTTFVGYEWTRAPIGANLHRNVMFRNDIVPSQPFSGVEYPVPEALWAELDAECISGLPGCDVLAIPHNSNLSAGFQFVPENTDGSPLTKEDALFRAAMEPIVEISQHKGDSECRPGVLTNDELCDFEKMDSITLGFVVPGPYDPRLFVRNIMKEGLEVDEALGANPFMMGIISATDTHNSIPGLTHEDDYKDAGHLGTRDGSPEFMMATLAESALGGVETHGGGHAVVWAEENSRDAIFAAMRRREVYGTSGTRPTLRMFAGEFPKNVCDKGTVVEEGYRRGVPMGAPIGAVRKNRSPRFSVMAVKDPGPVGGPSMPLQRLQVIKGWLDDEGNSQEQVFEVAGNPNNGATVDESTCIPSGSGFDTLCAVWEDPEFDPNQRAFYYARVVENPTCRWSQFLCNEQGVDCNVPASIPAGLEECCTGRPTTIQERAWSSPIWYRPEEMGKSKGKLKLKGDGRDQFQFKTLIERAPAELNPNVHDIEITVTDDDEIYSATIPAGTMQETQAGAAWRYKGIGTIDGIKRASLRISKGRAKFSVRTIDLDLSNADLTDHFVETTISASTYSASHSRLWEARKNSLRNR